VRFYFCQNRMCEPVDIHLLDRVPDLMTSSYSVLQSIPLLYLNST